MKGPGWGSKWLIRKLLGRIISSMGVVTSSNSKPGTEWLQLMTMGWN
jgi:hypothetical protein